MMRFLAIDQGTTSTRAVLVDPQGNVEVLAALPHAQSYPHPGWVEHDPAELIANIRACLAAAAALHGSTAGGVGAVVAVGLANQGESCLAWDARTGDPLGPVIVWQDARTAADTAALRAAGHERTSLSRAGLPLDPYFSASKLAWAARNAPGAAALAAEGRLRLGTTDAWFRRQLGLPEMTDPTTASRTGLMNLAHCRWDPLLCALHGVPIAALPPIGPTTGLLGWLPGGLRLTASVVDQQAALYGHGCRLPGDAKITFGTGAFALALTGGLTGDSTGNAIFPAPPQPRPGAVPNSGPKSSPTVVPTVVLEPATPPDAASPDATPPEVTPPDVTPPDAPIASSPAHPVAEAQPAGAPARGLADLPPAAPPSSDPAPAAAAGGLAEGTGGAARPSGTAAVDPGVPPPVAGALPTVAWQAAGLAPVYALDGGVYAASSAVNWARKLGLFTSFDQIGAFARAPAIDRGLAFVPALAGLACPHWDRQARGAWLGVGLDTDRDDLMQALLEGVALRTAEVMDTIAARIALRGPIPIDGGMSANPAFTRFLADVLDRPILVADTPEVTALGTAALAALGAGQRLDAPRRGRLITPDPAARPLRARRMARFAAARAAVQAYGADLA